MHEHIHTYMATHRQRQQHLPSTQTGKSLRAAAGPVRAAVFVKHCVTPAPEQQSSPANPPHTVSRVPAHSRHGSLSFPAIVLLSVIP